MDQVHVVRHKVLEERRSQRVVRRELGLARVTVRKYLEEAVAAREAGGRASATTRLRRRTARAGVMGRVGGVDGRQTATDRHAAP
jgi:hypothetical protein